MSKRAILILSLVLGTLGLLFSGFFWDFLAIREVVIEGGERITTDDVQDMIDVKVGDNLFRVNVQAATAQLNRHPWIRSAKVSRRFFRLHIFIQERYPFAVVQLPEGDVVWCDKEGYVLDPFSAGEQEQGEQEQAAPATVTGLGPMTIGLGPTIVGLGPVIQTAGGPRVGSEAQWELIRLMSRLDASFLSETVRIQFYAGGFDLLTQEGIRIRLPLTGTSDALRRLKVVWPTLEKRVSFQSVDLRFPGELVYGGSLH